MIPCFKRILKISHCNYLVFCGNLAMNFAIFSRSALLFNSFYCFFPSINKILRPNNLKIRTAMNVKISVFVICVEGIIYLLLYNLHERSINRSKHFYIMHLNIHWSQVFIYLSITCSESVVIVVLKCNLMQWPLLQ